MRRKSFEDFDCSLAQAADYLGDAWVLLILRNIFNGMRRFDEINSHLEIPTNTLSDRLKTLVGRGIFRREPDPVDGRVKFHLLTVKGKVMYEEALRRLSPDVGLIFAEWNAEDLDALHARLFQLKTWLDENRETRG